MGNLILEMSTVQEYQQIGPALRCRYAFESGVFKLEKTFVGWNLVREDTFGHQVSWDTDPTWKTTYREIYIYKVAHFFIRRISAKCIFDTKTFRFRG